MDKTNENHDWKYHDFRDSNIQNYIPAMENLSELGLYAVRMGAVVKGRLNTANPAIFDYANCGKRTDFLDIYLDII